MPLDVAPNQEFLKFISIHENKNKFNNLELILNLDKKYNGMFVKLMSYFDDAKLYRESINENGKTIKVSWEEALEKFYLSNKYVGVTNENIDIAELFGHKGIPQNVFDEANYLRQEAKKTNVPEHILGKPLKEETILESIERIKKQTDEEILSGREIIEELYDKKFTYEWLNKNDPHNSILGLFCSCCGTIISPYYGQKIAKASVVAPDVQNIIVRDSKGDIVSKGTMYVNKDRGYAVINDFELNTKYREHELSEGRYNVKEDSPEEQDREMIFKAYQRGLKAFIEEYDKQHPKNPLKQINVGMGYNRLKKQVERFKIATVNLTVPYEYSFEDAMQYEQYILYKRGQEQIENEEHDK